MAIETGDDLAAFFDVEGFGEAAVYSSYGQDAIALVVIRNLAMTDLIAGNRTTPVDTLTFDLRADLVTPETDALLEVGIVDPVSLVFTALERYEIDGEPRRAGDGALWRVEVRPI